jgi:hypothetical protein
MLRAAETGLAPFGEPCGTLTFLAMELRLTITRKERKGRPGGVG